jgi:hypothetical protein
VGDEELQTVRTLLTAAGLNPPADEIERLAGLYPALRRSLDRFHRIDAGDEVTAAVFRAERRPEPTGGSR